ncbi:unnamed protein product [Brassica rapa subsp. trilocularis]
MALCQREHVFLSILDFSLCIIIAKTLALVVMRVPALTISTI